MSPFAPVEWRLRSRTLTTADHTLVMGILNVTPDSFSDGGRHASVEDAVQAGLAMAAAGADIVDVGGESTRPGSEPVTVEEEMTRVVPVVAELSAAGVVVSVDTSKPEVVAAGVEAGAEIVNDVSALEAHGMVEICVELEPAVVLMHKQGTPATMQVGPRYDDVVADVGRYLDERAADVERCGVDPQRICVDPGIGFGKTLYHNLRLLAEMSALTAAGRPVLVGTSRKAFIGKVLDAAGRPTPPERRDAATVATTALAIASGAAVVRVHDVPATVDSARIADAIVRVGSAERNERE
jgi:dihydropteroate synthase